MSIPEFSHAFTIANEAGLSLDEQEAQWKRKDFIMLQKGSIELAEKKGAERGREQGREEGREEGIAIGVEKGILEGKLSLVAKVMTVEEAAEVAGVEVDLLRSSV